MRSFPHLDSLLSAVLFVVLVGGLSGCPVPPVQPGVDGGPELDAGTDGGTNPDGEAALVPGWNPTTQVGPTRDGSSVEIRNVSVDLAREGTDAIVVWEEAGDDRGSIWARSFVAGVWLPEHRLSPAEVDAHLPVVALNEAGQAVVAFLVEEESEPGVSLGSAPWFTRLEGGTWSGPERLGPVSTGEMAFHASDPGVGIDAQGRVSVTWSQYVSNQPDSSGLYLRRHDGTSWSEPLRLNEGTLPASDPQLAVNPAGAAVVVWVQDTNPYDPGQPGGGPRISNTWARVFNGTTWGAPIRIGPELVAFEGVERPVVAIDAVGRAFALWEERRSEEARIGTARFDPDLGTWDAPANVASSAAPTHHLSFLSIAADDRGNALATWTANLPDSDEVAGVAARFEGSTKTWSTPSAFTTRWSLAGTRAALGNTGQGWALYTQPNDAGTSELTARELRPDGSWGEAQVIGHTSISDVEANAEGVVLVGSRRSWYANSAPLRREAPSATFFLP